MQNEVDNKAFLDLNLLDSDGNNLFIGRDYCLDERKDVWVSNNLLYFLGGWQKYMK